MMRICGSLSVHYDVLLVGKKDKSSKPLEKLSYRQKRLSSWFRKGKLSYIEYNLRLFFFLFFKPTDAICAIDLDTILPCYLVSRLRKIPRIYDAHELFCEMKEIVERPFIYKCWKWLERHTVPYFTSGYTVNQVLADEFRRMYGVKYRVIRNMPLIRDLNRTAGKGQYLLYQGGVNEGRSFETLIPAMQWVNSVLIICGEGNFLVKAKQLVKDHHLEDKVIFKGYIVPSELWQFTKEAAIGITLFDKVGASNYYSLANRFFDYIQAGIPQLCVDYPVYKEINGQYRVALLVDDLSPENLAASLNNLLDNDVLYQELQENCFRARTIYNWQNEEKYLLDFYQQILN
jgi:glycosyltransferase involved in cell wall biosynthesis